MTNGDTTVKPDPVIPVVESSDGDALADAPEIEGEEVEDQVELESNIRAAQAEASEQLSKMVKARAQGESRSVRRQRSAEIETAFLEQAVKKTGATTKDAAVGSTREALAQAAASEEPIVIENPGEEPTYVTVEHVKRLGRDRYLIKEMDSAPDETERAGTTVSIEVSEQEASVMQARAGVKGYLSNNDFFNGNYIDNEDNQQPLLTGNRESLESSGEPLKFSEDLPENQQGRAFIQAANEYAMAMGFKEKAARIFALDQAFQYEGDFGAGLTDMHQVYGAYLDGKEQQSPVDIMATFKSAREYAWLRATNGEDALAAGDRERFDRRYDKEFPRGTRDIDEWAAVYDDGNSLGKGYESRLFGIERQESGKERLTLEDFEPHAEIYDENEGRMQEAVDTGNALLKAKEKEIEEIEARLATVRGQIADPGDLSEKEILALGKKRDKLKADMEKARTDRADTYAALLDAADNPKAIQRLTRGLEDTEAHFKASRGERARSADTRTSESLAGRFGEGIKKVDEWKSMGLKWMNDGKQVADLIEEIRESGLDALKEVGQQVAQQTTEVMQMATARGAPTEFIPEFEAPEKGVAGQEMDANVAAGTNPVEGSQFAKADPKLVPQGQRTPETIRLEDLAARERAQKARGRG